MKKGKKIYTTTCWIWWTHRGGKGMGQYIHATKPAGVSNACEVSNGGGKLEGREGGKGRMREANARGIYASKRKKKDLNFVTQ